MKYFKWLYSWITQKPCVHCNHPLTSHEDYPNPLGPGRCYDCIP